MMEEDISIEKKRDNRNVNLSLRVLHRELFPNATCDELIESDYSLLFGASQVVLICSCHYLTIQTYSDSAVRHVPNQVVTISSFSRPSGL